MVFSVDDILLILLRLLLSAVKITFIAGHTVTVCVVISVLGMILFPHDGCCYLHTVDVDDALLIEMILHYSLISRCLLTG